MAKNSGGYGKIFRQGLIDNNPTFVQLLGMCPTLAITTTVVNGLGMGLCTTFVLIFSNLFISILRKFIPPKARIASYIVIIAGFVTVIDLLMKAYFYDLSGSLGLFIPLIVVNCIILARAESFASRNKPLPSLCDGLATGLGFTAALLIISSVREIVGYGTFLGFDLFGGHYDPALLIVLPSGGFLVLGLLIALVQFLRSKKHGQKENERE